MQCRAQLPTTFNERSWGRCWLCLHRQGHKGKHLVAADCQQDLTGTNWERAPRPVIEGVA